MDDADFVGGLEAGADFHHDGDGPADRQRVWIAILDAE
jgi:hypothetical protein